MKLADEKVAEALEALGLGADQLDPKLLARVREVVAQPAEDQVLRLLGVDGEPDHRLVASIRKDLEAGRSPTDVARRHEAIAAELPADQRDPRRLAEEAAAW